MVLIAFAFLEELFKASRALWTTDSADWHFRQRTTSTQCFNEKDIKDCRLQLLQSSAFPAEPKELVLSCL